MALQEALRKPRQSNGETESLSKPQRKYDRCCEGMYTDVFKARLYTPLGDREKASESFRSSFGALRKPYVRAAAQAAKGREGGLRDLLGDDIWRCITLKLDIQSLHQLRKVNTSFQELVQAYMLETWEKWNAWKNQVPLYPPEVSGYSTAAKSVDKLLFESLVCMTGPQKLQLGSFEREGRRCTLLCKSHKTLRGDYRKSIKNSMSSILAQCCSDSDGCMSNLCPSDSKRQQI